MYARVKGALWAVPAATWLAWLLPVFAWAPLTYPGYFEFGSGFTAVFNLTDLAARWADLAWAPTVGRSYDLLAGEGSLPYRLALLPLALGMPATGAIKTAMALSLLAGALGSYAWVRRAFGDWAGLLAAVVYVLWPLNLAAAYVHGAFADTVFIGLAPWVLWSAAPARQDSDLAPQRRGDGQDTNFALHYVVLALGIAGLLWVRVGLGLWFAAVVLAYLLIANRSRLSLLAWIAGLVLGMLGLIPLLVGRGLGAGAAGDFVSQLIDPYRLFSAGPGLATGASRGGSAVYELGLVALGLAVLTLVLPAGDHNPRSRQTARLAGLLVIVATLLSTTLSGTLWRLLPGFSRTLAHPWELFLLAGPWLAWLAASAVARLYRTALGSARLPLAAAMLALVVLASYPYLAPPSTGEAVPSAPAAVFGVDQVALLDARISGLPQAGETVTATVRWQALRPLTQDYTVFFQAVGPDGHLWGQQDILPGNGEALTSGWQPGRVISDTYHLALKAGAPAGGYTYYLGLYQWQTGERLPTDGDDKVVVTTGGEGSVQP